MSLLPFEKVLFDGALRLLDKKHFWAGKTVFQIACFHMLREVRYGVLWPLGEPFGWEMKIAFFGGAFVPRLTFMVFVQTMLEGTVLCLYNTCGRFKSNHNDSDAEALRYAIGRAQETLEKEFENEDYGPRLALRRRLFALLYLIVPDFGRHLELEGALIMKEAKTLQADADHNEDCAMQDMLKILDSVLSLKVSRASFVSRRAIYTLRKLLAYFKPSHFSTFYLHLMIFISLHTQTKISAISAWGIEAKSSSFWRFYRRASLVVAVWQALRHASTSQSDDIVLVYAPRAFQLS